MIDAFRRNIADHSARVGNLAEAELCIQLLSMAYASQADGARPQRLSAPLAAGTQAACPVVNTARSSWLPSRASFPPDRRPAARQAHGLERTGAASSAS